MAVTPHDDVLSELLLRWHDHRAAGRDVSADELCAAQPERAAELQRQIAAIRSMERLLSPGIKVASRTLVDSADGTVIPAARGGASPPGYEILDVIDQGGMGVVYKAKQVRLNRVVALKMIAGPRAAPRQIARFRAEAEAVAQLQHANIVQVFEVGELDGHPFLSMEYVAGGNLAEQLRRKRPSPTEAAELIETLARTMQAAHECGIVHRDLKPANVLLLPDGTPKITDFGLAKRLDAEGGHTHSGEILGTPNYMSPEQAESRREDVGPATDVYALGAILYELLTGQPPLTGSTTLETLRKITCEDPASPRKLNALVPRDLEAICAKCLEKTLARRYRTAGELADDLRRFLDGRSVTARPVRAIGRAARLLRRRRDIVITAAAVLILTAAGLAVWGYVNHLRREGDIAAEVLAKRDRAVRLAPQARDILHHHCHECHGADPEKIERNLDVFDRGRLLDAERKIVVPGDVEHSRLMQRIADGSMPPEEEEQRLPRVSQAELEVLSDWIAGGAPAFPPPTMAEPPAGETDSPLAADVKRIFIAKCFGCHKSNVARGGIKILHHRLLVHVRKVVMPGNAEASELFRLVVLDGPGQMPPADSGLSLSAAEIAAIRDWIESGAPPFPKG